MSNTQRFDISDFTPYLLAQAADTASLGFQQYYKSKYGMLRTEWRVVFHLGRYGNMTAKDICTKARIHKTKVSRAVRALELKRYLSRTQLDDDRRHENLDLTGAGRQVFDDLLTEAERFDRELMAGFSAEEVALLRRCLITIADL